jgi:hypothetical protein
MKIKYTKRLAATMFKQLHIIVMDLSGMRITLATQATLL